MVFSSRVACLERVIEESGSGRWPAAVGPCPGIYASTVQCLLCARLVRHHMTTLPKAQPSLCVDKIAFIYVHKDFV